MLRITVEEKSEAVVLKLEGRLAGPWAAELGRLWEEKAPALQQKKAVARSAGNHVCRCRRNSDPESHLLPNRSRNSRRHTMDPVSCRRSGKHELSTSGLGGSEMHNEHTKRTKLRHCLLTGRASFSSRCRPQALADLEPLLAPSSYPSGMVLFSETQPASGIYVVLEGEVKLSINSRRRPPPELPHRQSRRSAGPFVRALRRRVRNDRRHSLPGKNRAHLAPGFPAIPCPATPTSTNRDARNGPQLQPRLRATAHGRPLNLGARAAGAPAAGVERRARPEARSAARAAACR